MQKIKVRHRMRYNTDGRAEKLCPATKGVATSFNVSLQQACTHCMHDSKRTCNMQDNSLGKKTAHTFMCTISSSISSWKRKCKGRPPESDRWTDKLAEQHEKLLQFSFTVMNMANLILHSILHDHCLVRWNKLPTILCHDVSNAGPVLSTPPVPNCVVLAFLHT
jgi:hypothetical protein